MYGADGRVTIKDLHEERAAHKAGAGRPGMGEHRGGDAINAEKDTARSCENVYHLNAELQQDVEMVLDDKIVSAVTGLVHERPTHIRRPSLHQARASAGNGRSDGRASLDRAQRNEPEGVHAHRGEPADILGRDVGEDGFFSSHP